jgi:hypothetical protein
MTTLAERLAAGDPITEIDRVDIAELDAHDNIFQEIDLQWWLR